VALDNRKINVYYVNMTKRDGFPERLLQARIKRKLTHSELGRLVGKHRTTICNYEGGVGYPTVATIILLAEVLHVSVDHLLGRRQAGY